MKIKRAIVSVSDKTGLIPLAEELARLKVEIFSTGGTLALLQKNKIRARSISELTEFPEILEGRVKTLHPKVHGGLLFLRSSAKQAREAKKHGIQPIDLVVVNLYPFRETIRKPGVTLKEAVEQIDIGGPSMLRSAAKNFESVAVVSDPADYPALIEELKKEKGGISSQFRRTLALKAFRQTSAYDREINRYLGSRFQAEESFPTVLDASYERVQVLRYGENPHQRAAYYQPPAPADGKGSRFSFEQLHGKELSYNNLLDFEAALDVIREFRDPAACVVKHNNPCGISEDKRLPLALTQALDGDLLSAFGGIVAVNRICDETAAQIVLEKLSFFELMIAPDYSERALELLKAKKNLRVLKVLNPEGVCPYELRFLRSGLLVQDRDLPIPEHEQELRKKIRWATEKKLGLEELDELVFAWKCAKVVRSNSIVLTQGKQTVGIGGGQMSRVDSVKIACMKAGERTRGSILASDGFFPMTDNIEVAHAHGIRAIIQPGGSIKDQDVIDACNRFGIAMAFTGERHFKH